jgi:hypothetical protein
LSLRVSAPSFALLRSIETGQEIRLDIQQEASVSLLPGAYQVVVGYESGGWDVRNVTVSRNVPDQQVAFTAPAGTVNAVWQGPADGTVGAAGPLSASLQVGAEQAQALPLRQPLQLLVPEGATDATVTLRRSDHDVWEQRHRVSPGATTEITLSGGPVWVTAGPTAQGASSEWRLIDQTQDPPALTYFRGARFAQPLAPGVYQLSVDGTKLCAEGESFKVRIGRPVDFGTGPSWITKGICE